MGVQCVKPAAWMPAATGSGSAKLAKLRPVSFAASVGRGSSELTGRVMPASGVACQGRAPRPSARLKVRGRARIVGRGGAALERRRTAEEMVRRIRASDRSRAVATLEPLAPDLWVARRPLPLVVGDVGARMTVVRLRDGGLVLHSPVRADDETRAASTRSARSAP